MDAINDFANWQRLLDGEKIGIDANEPWPGYYKVRRRGRDGYSPVAYWCDEKTGELRCHMDGTDLGLQRALEIWPYAAKNPVSYEDYGERLRTGKWPGESDAVRNHNAAPPDDSVEAIAERIDDLAREAEKMIRAGAASDDNVSDQASDLANTFSELEGKIAGLHKSEKAPHLEAGRGVDTKWFGLRDKAADLKRRLKLVVVTPWLNKKTAEADKAAADAIAKGAAPESVPQVRTTAGASKRATALRTQKKAEVTDWGALLAALHEHPEIRETAQRIANASAKAGVALPGMKITEIKVAA
jgi:hypothetical protein